MHSESKANIAYSFFHSIYGPPGTIKERVLNPCRPEPLGPSGQQRPPEQSEPSGHQDH